MQTLIHHFLEYSAAQYPDKIAFRQGDTTATYKTINDQANRLAHWLVERGLTPGDRVALLMENSLTYIIGYYGALKSGAIVAPLNHFLKPDGLKDLIARLMPKVILSNDKSGRLLRATLGDQPRDPAVMVHHLKAKPAAGPSLAVDWDDALSDRPTTNLDMDIDSDQSANIIFTSGSEGAPKGVLLSHGNITANTQAICRYLELTRDDVQMVVLPFFYVMGQSLMNTHFAVGGTLVVNNQFAYPATVIQDMIDYQVTGFSGVPSTYAYLLHRSPLAAKRSSLSSLRYCSQAGGHMPRKVKEDLRRVLPEYTQIFIMYGATEAAARLTYLPPQYFEPKMGSIGIPIPGVQMKVVGPDGSILPHGQVGELVASGPNIMQGYWQDVEATRKVLDSDGAYHTGDLGYVDGDGFYYVDGRRDDIIKVGGHRINPLEVESVIMDSGIALECIVMGIKDEMMGNRLMALVVPSQSDMDYDYVVTSIMEYCAERLPRYKWPFRIGIERMLPKTGNGKIDRYKSFEILGKLTNGRSG